MVKNLKTNDKSQMTNKLQNSNDKKFDIYERSLDFAAKVAKLLNKLPKNFTIVEYAKQLIR